MSFDWTIRIGNRLSVFTGLPLSKAYQHFLPSEVELQAGSLLLNVVCQKSTLIEVKTQKPCKDNDCKILVSSKDKKKRTEIRSHF